jgi:hypothetical protein
MLINFYCFGDRHYTAVWKKKLAKALGLSCCVAPAPYVRLCKKDLLYKES